ncbi:LysE family transporter [Georgenia sp. TF02-10]|uniref:LysE family translocator n=1 Tax=Georgenia sp. TF02-10 TaxID=2917725 RepID=UPI001FA7A53B|nr:LysE family transporter [Georgenia sp. TF02-10]UNX56377.1 LysE family transporter [Georgenia sp. TF02-10]
MDLTAVQPYLSLTAVALVVMGSPGPATLAVMASGIAFGVRPSLPYLVGSTVGTIAVLAVVGAGLATVVLAQPVLAPVFLVVAVGYLLYLAVKVATAAPGAAGSGPVRPPSWASGVGLAVTNPKAYAGLGTVLASSELPLPDPALEAAVQVGVLSVLVVVIHVVWLLGAAAFGTLLRRPRTARVVNVVMALALVASTLPAILSLLR